jgi:hypothetical protein
MYTYLLTNIIVLKNIHSSLSNMDNINIKVKQVIDNPEILEFMKTTKPANSEKEGEENYEMYKYLMENVFCVKKAEEKKPEETKTEVKPVDGAEQKVEAQAVPENKEE